MLKIIITDQTAAARSRLVRLVNRHLSANSAELEFMPQISVKPLAAEELKYHGEPDLCIVGSELIKNQPGDIARIRKLYPATPLIVQLEGDQNSIASIEQLARLGADDTLELETTSEQFLRKLVLLARRTSKHRSGTLVVIASGKGGMGVTSITAALGEALVDQGHRVALLDFDSDTQDLSRFLQARPYLNENLQLLLSRQRPVTEEFVQQCLVRVWQDMPQLACMPPAVETEELSQNNGEAARVLLGILDVLDSQFDYVLVDVGNARGAILRTLYRAANCCLFLVNNDPAALYAAADKIGRVRAALNPDGRLLILENNLQRWGLPQQILRTELVKAAQLSSDAWLSVSIPYSKLAFRWPGSGASMYAFGRSSMRSALTIVARGLVREEVRINNDEVVPWWRVLGRRVWKRRGRLSPSNIFELPANGRPSLLLTNEGRDELTQVCDTKVPELGMVDNEAIVDFRSFVSGATIS